MERRGFSCSPPESSPPGRGRRPLAVRRPRARPGGGPHAPRRTGAGAGGGHGPPWALMPPIPIWLRENFQSGRCGWRCRDASRTCVHRLAPQRVWIVTSSRGRDDASAFHLGIRSGHRLAIFAKARRRARRGLPQISRPSGPHIFRGERLYRHLDPASPPWGAGSSFWASR